MIRHGIIEMVIIRKKKVVKALVAIISMLFLSVLRYGQQTIQFNSRNGLLYFKIFASERMQDHFYAMVSDQ